ncbi:M48 family metalloprotease [soil metagenome]
MLRLIVIAALIGAVMYFVSAWRLKGELDRKSVPLKDPVLDPVLRRLARSLDVDALRVHLYEIEPINGLAAPDGRVFVTRGLFDKYRRGEVTAEEIASVIAHELGHVALGHSRRRMFDFTGANALRMGLAMVLGRFIPFVGAYIAGFVAQILQAALSRKDEYEADEYAAALMVKAGFGVTPQIAMFEKLDAMSGAAGRPPAWLMSHPATGKRIAAIRALEARWLGTERRQEGGE